MGHVSDLLTRLEIKGREGDDAVLCTESKTYALRSVNISNSLHVATGSEEVPYARTGEELFLGEAIHEIMELVPTVPKLDRLKGALRGSEYGVEEWDTRIREDSVEQVPFDPPTLPMPWLSTYVVNIRSSGNTPAQRWLKSYKPVRWNSQRPSEISIF
jgi:hypothetical protein